MSQTKVKVSFWRIFWPSLTAVLVVSLIGWMITFSIIGSLTEKEPDTTDRTILHMSLSGKIAETSSAKLNPGAFSIDRSTGLSDILYGLKAAAKDKSVKGIYLDLDNVECGYATATEIRNAIHAFRKSGKFAVAFLNGEVITTKQYYIASSAGEVYGFPTSAMEFMGLGAELMYFKGTLDKLGVQMQIVRGSNNDFKSAVEPLFLDHMSDSSRLQVSRYLNSLWFDVRTAIAADRKISVDELNSIAENMKIQRVEDAVSYKLVDAVKYHDEVVEILRKKAGGKLEDSKLMAFEKYARDKFKAEQQRRTGEKSGADIAVVVAEGDITVDGDELSSKKICKLFRDIRKDKGIKAVVFRINSPGGSALASEEIWREVMLTAKTRKVTVSMGDVAASGGYYIATGASTIFAEKTTITGSIGVFGIIPFIGDALNSKLGVSFDRVQTNSHAVLTLNKKLSPEELQVIQGEVDQIYTQFKERVAAGRGLTGEQVERLARGRVWTGADAVNIGLVDKIGGLEDAIAFAAKQSGIRKPEVKYFPEWEDNPIQELIEKMADDDSETAVKMEKTEIPAEVDQTLRIMQKLESYSGIQARLPWFMQIR